MFEEQQITGKSVGELASFDVLALWSLQGVEQES